MANPGVPLKSLQATGRHAIERLMVYELESSTAQRAVRVGLRP